MITIEQVHIEHIRGIRELTLDLNSKSFVISGPNGSGKSGVVDAVEFGLTGAITRLTGKGTGGLSLATHGPHIDMKEYPDAAFVRLTLHIASLGKTATLTRWIKKPKQPTIEPDDEDVRSALEEVRAHPEITLSRREIIKFILAEATKRSQDVQTLLLTEPTDAPDRPSPDQDNGSSRSPP